MNLLHTILDILRNSILITGLVIVMMMMIEALNIESHGRFFSRLRRTRLGQVVFGAALGLIPGCIGGFATVSLYTHGLFSFGALIAMMIASSGDEAFVMLAMFPQKALVLFAVLFAVAVVTGVLTDAVGDRLRRKKNAGAASEPVCCDEGFEIHEHEDTEPHEHGKRHFGWKRAVLAVGLAVFIAALGSGFLEHDHGSGTHSHGDGEPVAAEQFRTGKEEPVSIGHSHEGQEGPGRHTHNDGHIHDTGGDAARALTINLLDESWMNILFACLSVVMLGVIIFASDHFVEEHLWHHVIRKHFLNIFLWTFGVLAAIAVLMHFIDIGTWVSDNTALMILFAVAVGIIPESGPHLIFVTLFAAGIVPFPVLLASSISQDGHASIPLLAESKSAFLRAKVINCLAALVCGFTAMIFM